MADDDAHFDSDSEEVKERRDIPATSHVAAMGGDTAFLASSVQKPATKGTTVKAIQRERTLARRERELFVGEGSDTALDGRHYRLKAVSSGWQRGRVRT